MAHAATVKPQEWRKAAAARAWETIRAKKAQQIGEIRQAQTTETLEISELQIVQLYLLCGVSKTDEMTAKHYAPGAPVLGQSHYVVVGRKERKVILFHPWTLVRFEIPAFSFRPQPADASVTLPKVLASIDRVVRVRPKDEVPQYVAQIRAALAQKAVN